MTEREFEICFKRLYMPLGMYALRIVCDADTAEDAVQDSFMKAWQCVSAGAEIVNFRAYMYRLVRNSCIDLLRARHTEVDVAEIPEAEEVEMDTSERDACIWRAIDGLPARCREVFLMSKRDGLSNREIAEELGISEKTVKNQMTKAFGRLRDALAPGHRPFFLPFL